MARFTPMELIDVMHGKFSRKSKYYAAEKYGTQYTGVVGEITVPPSEKQLAQRTRFATAKANIAELTEEQVAEYKEAFKKQHTYKTLQGYMQAMEMVKL